MNATPSNYRHPGLHSCLAFAALLMGPLVSNAGPVTYKVNLTVTGNVSVPAYTAKGTVVGTIKTDGKTGVLAATDILDWKLTLSDSGHSLTLTGPLSGKNSSILLNGQDLSATSSQLSFNFKGADGGVLGFQTVLFSGEQYLCAATKNQGDCSPGLSIVPTDVFGTSPWANGMPKSNVIASTGATTSTDLAETAVSASASTVLVGKSFTMSDTVKNEGKAAAGASVTRYYLSKTTTKTSAHLLNGVRKVSNLAAGAISSGKATVTAPTGTPGGTYHVLACADDTGTVTDSNSANNCLAAKTMLTVQLGADLLETATSISVSSVLVGKTFTISDALKNEGDTPAGASVTRYYLSATPAKTASSHLLNGTRKIPNLTVNAVSTGSVTVTVPASTSTGTYHVLACANDTGTVIESNRANNCKAATTMLAVHKGADLIETVASISISSALVGKTFTVGDTVKNQGDVAAGTSVTRYYLSTTATKTASSHLLNGTRKISSLAPGGISVGSEIVTIPTGTAVGTYHVLACANDTGTAIESNKTNNCSAATTTLAVHLGPDLVETAVSLSASSVAAGKSLSISDTAKNQGDVPAGPSVTRYYLSTTATKASSSHPLKGTRNVAGLATGGISSGKATVTVPSATAAGTYFVLACANDTGKVIESNKTNNCHATTKKLAVTKAAGQPTITLDTPASGTTALSGFAYDIDPAKYKVVVYGLTDRWHIQPDLSAPFNGIDPDGYWTGSANRWERLVVLAVDPALYKPVPSRVSNPVLDPGVLAWAQYPEEPTRVSFSGRDWGLRVTGNVPGDASGPGPNYWSDDPSVVNVGRDGLHLKIARIDDHWQSGEVYLPESLGYGTYTVRLSSPLDNLDDRTVAFPLWIGTAPLEEASRTGLGNEYRGADSGSKTSNARTVLQTDAASGDSRPYVQPATDHFTSQIEWQADHVTFRIWDGWSNNPAPADMIQERTYSGKDIAPLGLHLGQERVHINLWLVRGEAPTNSEGDEMVIHSFTYQP